MHVALAVLPRNEVSAIGVSETLYIRLTAAVRAYIKLKVIAIYMYT